MTKSEDLPGPKIIAMRKITLPVLGGIALLIGSNFAVVQAQNISVTLISTFDSPPGSILDTRKINDSGTFAASFIHQFTVLGCRVYPGGNFSAPFSEPNDDVGYTTAEGINAGGEVCGRYDGGDQTHGYFRRGSTFKTYDVPVREVSATTVDGLNDAHNFVGIYTVFGGSAAFAYASIDGNLITIPISGLQPEATGINNLNDVVGVYGDNDGGMFHGFMRASDGTLTFPIDFPSAAHTVPEAINDAGYIVGYWTDNVTSHALIIRLPDTFLSYDVPGATFTSFSGINNSGLIVGTYADQQHETHGLLAQLNQ